MTAGWDQIDVDGAAMRAYTALPSSAGPHPGLVIVQHAPGVDTFIQEMARRFAAEGYAAVAPDLFHREPPETEGDTKGRNSRLIDANVVADCQAAAGFLRAHPAVDAKRVGVVGFCIGGRIAYVAASATPGLQALVLFYPAYLGVAWGGGPTALERTDGITAPMLALLGAEDHNPTPDEARHLDELLTSLGKPHDFGFHDGAGHAFMDYTQPARYREGAARQAWNATLQWLAARLT